MPMVMWGADTDQLLAWSERASTGGQHVAESLERVDRAVRVLGWHGPDAEVFRGRWDVLCAAARTAGEDLRTRADAARGHAQEQEAASAADADAGGGGGTAAERQEADGFFGGWEDGGSWPWQKDRDLRDDIPLDDTDAYGLDAMNQQGVPNCLVVATLGALSEQDPEFFQEHITKVGPEEYEVTLYDESGNPVVYTVEGRIAGDGMVGADGEQSWMSLYEDALIQHGTLSEGDDSWFGGDETEAGSYSSGYQPHELSATITGAQGDHFTLYGSHDPRVDEISPSHLADRIESGGSVVLGTHNSNADTGENDLVEQHAYVVESVNDDSTVTVVNPWGAGGNYSEGGGHRMDIPMDELHHHFEEAWVTPGDDTWKDAA